MRQGAPLRGALCLAPLTLALRLTQALPGHPAHMVESRAILLGAGSFVVCLALFLALDVSLIFLVGPAMAIGYSSFLAYKSARDDVR